MPLASGHEDGALFLMHRENRGSLLGVAPGRTRDAGREIRERDGRNQIHKAGVTEINTFMSVHYNLFMILLPQSQALVTETETNRDPPMSERLL